MLSHSIRRLKKVAKDMRVVVATSDLIQDDAIEELAKREKTPCFRGPEKDVLDRFYKAAKKYEAKIIIRATGDNPLVDPVEAERVVDAIEYGNYHYVTGFCEVNEKNSRKESEWRPSLLERWSMPGITAQNQSIGSI
jgi:spore coat polysaccharide biosynthesis protein SpsF